MLADNCRQLLAHHARHRTRHKQLPISRHSGYCIQNDFIRQKLVRLANQQRSRMQWDVLPRDHSHQIRQLFVQLRYFFLALLRRRRGQLPVIRSHHIAFIAQTSGITDRAPQNARCACPGSALLKPGTRSPAEFRLAPDPSIEAAASALPFLPLRSQLRSLSIVPAPLIPGRNAVPVSVPRERFQSVTGPPDRVTIVSGRGAISAATSASPNSLSCPYNTRSIGSFQLSSRC